MSESDKLQVLERVYSEFLQMPYENLTKIISRGRVTGEAERLPETVRSDFEKYGTGGTCFSVCFTLMENLDRLGFDSRLYLADRSFGPSTHCFLITTIDGTGYLLDPAFLVERPVRLSFRYDGDSIGENGFFFISEAGKIRCISSCEGRITRYVSHERAATDQEFHEAWKRSFSNPMLNRFNILKLEKSKSNSSENRILYLSHNVFRIYDRNGKKIESTRLRGDPGRISEIFGLSRDIVEAAAGYLPEKRRKQLGF